MHTQMLRCSAKVFLHANGFDTIRGWRLMSGLQLETEAPSIFRANLFGSWVFTHSLENDDYQAYLAAVYIKQHLLILDESLFGHLSG